MYVYSAKTNSFYPVKLQLRYIDAGSWPDDGIEVSEETYLEFSTPPEGKMLIADDDGLPVWADIPPPTSKELQRGAESKKQHLIKIAKEKIDIFQDAVDLGLATDAEKSTLTQWRRYRVLLNRVDCAIASHIDWPEQPE
ncbi:putative CPS-53 (KpLE1) prophage; tail fiber assembly [Xenorhabdus bovienii str. Jollieti]|uniref:Putative CPS-53 (KpLE1) prophage tail fiber assembly n=1 Tax=Xenorhabdus bovienii (strain SS-2004) TaxID=406818 RepID=D3UZS5_XENBS|nr:tail fiber assembly protein [Xenorhabdus bovienii]CBJ80158.1 putative CPS-53 (KpLE1) prophage; tail fiber assembly [Xenorhabdus bovienii SS-2004]CDH29869.1 putative CPS-53 (KpLE1) prophage; tail fiber assembly [Xenorhabdus bovienii str. Jollieti]